MTTEHCVLAVTVFLSRLVSGLLEMLCTILRPMQAAMTGQEFQNLMGTFLWYAADLPGFPLGKVYNYAWSAGTTSRQSSRLCSFLTIPAPPRSCSPRSAWAS
jgi:hypothetical protein